MNTLAMWNVEVTLTSAVGGSLRENHILYADRETAVEFVKNRAMKSAVKKFGTADGLLVVTRCRKED